jgi:hypothetical protein
MGKNQGDFRFGGFDTPRYTPTPDQIFDELLAPSLLTEAELRVLLYIVRRTFGWKKDCDEISLSQITGGIVKRDGTRLDWGAGVAKSTAVRAIKGLVEKEIIRVERNFREDGGSDVTTFSLHMREGGLSAEDEATAPVFRGRTHPGPNGKHGGFHDRTRGGTTVKQVRFQAETGGGSQAKPAPVARRNTQESSEQDTLKQEGVDSNQTPLEKKKVRKLPKAGAPRYSAYIAEVTSDFSGEMGNADQVVSNVTQALRIWETSGLGEREFVEIMYDAKRRTRLYQGKNGLRGIENKMGYFFQVLRRLLDGPVAE